jgi:hypothetical protein
MNRLTKGAHWASARSPSSCIYTSPCCGTRGADMTLPGFSAAFSLYQGVGRYRAPAGSLFSGTGALDQAVKPAYIPGPVTEAKCYEVVKECLLQSLLLVFPPAVAVAQLKCAGRQFIPGSTCCPKLCEFDLSAFGAGCCDSGETCVNEQDRNARSGCCPAGQSVCGGNCCRPGEKCCGSSCCPASANCCGDKCGCQGGMHCQNGQCTYPPFDDDPYIPAPGVESIPKPATGCPAGWKECLNSTICCAPGIKCCGNGCAAACVN